MTSRIHFTGAILLGVALTASSSAPKKIPPNAQTIADALHAAGQVTAIDSFDKDPVGATQKFRFSSLTEEPMGSWKVKADFQAASAPHVFSHEPGPMSGHWELALWDSPPAGDAEITFDFKPVQGDPRLSGGVVWRYQNSGSFYLLELDSIDDTLRLYRYQKGRAKCIDTQMTIVTANRWHTFRLDFIAQTYSVYVDDELIMAGHDKTYLGAGSFGLVADSGSQFYYDNWAVKQIPKN